MTKQDISYGLIGIMLGLVVGFMVANWTWPPPTASSQNARGNAPQASVNSSSQGQELPPNHPPIDTGQTIPAPPLPPSAANSAATNSAPANSAAATSGSRQTDMPSLDPLPGGSKGARAEQQFKSIQALRGVRAEDVMPLMDHFNAALGVSCTYCHITGQEDKDHPKKKIAIDHIGLTRDNNRKLGGGGRMTCFTCHRGQAKPPG